MPAQPLDNSESTRQHDNLQKQRMKQYADTKRHAKPKVIKIGDTVLLKREGHLSNETSPYDPEPYKVTAINGSMVTAERNGRKVTRNSTFFKVLKNFTPPNDSANEDLDARIPAEPQEAQPVERRSQRIRRPPQYLKDFVVK